MRLSDALRIRPGQSIAFIGAGGKSTAIRTLVEELQPIHPIVSTTTTKLTLSQSNLAQKHLMLESSNSFKRVRHILRSGRSILVTNGQEDREPKWKGLDPKQMDELREVCLEEGALLLIEADGARMKSWKAPVEHEPVVPEWVDLVITMAGLEVIGKPFTSEYCHRAARAKELLGIEGDASIEGKHVSELLKSDQGGLKGIPACSRVRAFLRQSESQNDIEIGRKIAFDVLASDRIQSVIIGTLDPEKPIKEAIGRTAGIVLAAGSSTRLEGPKQLLPFRGKPLVSYAVESAQMAGLAPIVLVLGDHEHAIRQAVEGYDIKIVRNPNPDLGQSSSLQIGLNSMGSNVEAAIFLLADMPLISPDLMSEMIMRHRRGLSPIIVPYAGGRRGNPVLFDRVTFEKLSQIEGDRGGRVIFSAFNHERLEWDDSIHFDVDTPEDIERLRGLE